MTKRQKAARIAALQTAKMLLWKEYCGPTLKFKNVDLDDLRNAILDLHIQIENRLYRAVGDEYPKQSDENEQPDPGEGWTVEDERIANENAEEAANEEY